MTEASIATQLADAWRRTGQHNRLEYLWDEQDFVDAAVLTEVVSAELADLLTAARPYTSSGLPFTRMPASVAAVDLTRPGHLAWSLRVRHQGCLLDRDPRWLEPPRRNPRLPLRHGSKKPAPTRATLLRRGHGVAVTAWRRERTYREPNILFRGGSALRNEWLARRREAFEAILSRPRLSTCLVAELMRDLGLPAEADGVRVQGDLLAEEPSSAKGAGILIRAENLPLALEWSRHPQCSPELAHLIARALASTGDPTTVVELVLAPEANPIVQHEARQALVGRMLARERGGAVRFLALTSPWCPPRALQQALVSTFPHERYVAERHSQVQDEWRRLAAVVWPKESGPAPGAAEQMEMGL